MSRRSNPESSDLPLVIPESPKFSPTAARFIACSVGWLRSGPGELWMDSKFITDVQNCQKHHRNHRRTFGDDLMHSELPTAGPSTNNAHLSVSSRKPATKALIEEYSDNEIENLGDSGPNPFVQNPFHDLFHAQNFLFHFQIDSDDFVVPRE